MTCDGVSIMHAILTLSFLSFSPNCWYLSDSSSTIMNFSRDDEPLP